MRSLGLEDESESDLNETMDEASPAEPAPSSTSVGSRLYQSLVVALSSKNLSHRILIAGVTLGVLGAIGIGIIIRWTLRMNIEAGNSYDDEATPVPARPARPESQSCMVPPKTHQSSLTFDTATSLLLHSNYPAQPLSAVSEITRSTLHPRNPSIPPN